MTTETRPGTGPFGVPWEALPEVAVVLSYRSFKPGAGGQSILLRGDGGVRLVRTLRYRGPEEVVEGRLSPELAARVLALVEEEQLLAFDGCLDHDATRTLRLLLPGDREVVADLGAGTGAELERIHGALKMAALVACPEAVGRTFLTNL